MIMINALFHTSDFYQNFTKLAYAVHLGEHLIYKHLWNQKLGFMTEFFRKYYNQLDAFDHRRIWPQKENQKGELREESQRQDQNQDQSLNPNQNLEQRKNLLVDMQLAFLEEQKLSKKFLVEEISPQVK